jgi:hypothetical protein
VSVYARVCENPVFLHDKPAICAEYCELMEQPCSVPSKESTHHEGCTEEQEKEVPSQLNLMSDNLVSTSKRKISSVLFGLASFWDDH